MRDKTITADWARSIGACGACAKAANGGCSRVNDMIEAEGLEPTAALAAIGDRVEGETPRDEPDIQEMRQVS